MATGSDGPRPWRGFFICIYRQAGIKHGSSHSGRRTLAAKVLAVTGKVDTVQTILGHSHLDHTKPYLSVSQEIIRRAFTVAL
ncbi:tyrosine-type recombinase/integrase [Pseudomonas fulva]|uniref:tyrosine-type recombinase/integrase n=1 Tax=Pseudomonas fulva TaxID=47880 RepID=UPI002DD2FE6D|nr:tyrosine-type recombinase/integrase [Pseudomonas fulva]